MKLASALSERADLQVKLNQMGIRLNNNAKVQEGDSPAEYPDKLMEEMDRIIARMEELIVRINITNSKTVCVCENDSSGNKEGYCYNGKTITEIIAHRDCLKRKIQLIRNFLDNASDKVNRLTHTEIKIKSTISVLDTQKYLDSLSKELRETDEKLQELNWTTELL